MGGGVPGMPTQMPTMASAGGQPPTGMAGARNPQEDSLRKAMLMQYLMGGDEEAAIQGPNAALPSGSGMKGSGGSQNNPNAGLLNSVPASLPSRKRFIGGSYG